MVAFTGRCLTHRAEIMWLHGAWPEALEEARRAGRRSAEREERARGRRGRLPAGRGPCACAASSRRPRQAYREASRSGREPQPGLALLRLAQGDGAARGRGDPPGARRDRRAPAPRAAAAGAGRDPARGRRARGGARRRRRSSARIADGHESGMLGAMAALARGRGRAGRRRRPAPRWARRGAPRGCGSSSRRRTRRRARARWSGWPAARSATSDTAAFELEAARGVFAGLGAAPELARVEALMRRRRRRVPTA